MNYNVYLKGGWDIDTTVEANNKEDAISLAYEEFLDNPSACTWTEEKKAVPERSYRESYKRRHLRESGLPENTYITIDEVYFTYSKDNYETGEESYDYKVYGNKDLNCVGEAFSNVKDLVKSLAEELSMVAGYDLSDWELYDTDDSISLETYYTVNENWDEPSDSEWKQFKLGKINLYNVGVILFVSVHKSLSHDESLSILEAELNH